MNINNRLKKLRYLMKEEGIDAYIVPTGDPHQSEYVPDHYKVREWISGFTGSAGTVVVSQEVAGLWTDGRYYVQAENELAGSEIILFKMDEPGVPSYIEWLEENLDQDSCVGFDGRIVSQEEFKKLSQVLSYKNIKFKTDEDLVGKIWKDRPVFPNSVGYIHELRYAGIEAKEKIQRVREKMKKLHVDTHVIAKLDDIAWLYNIRGSDVPSNPMLISYALITMDKAYLFIKEEKTDQDLIDYLSGQGIEVYEYEEVKNFLKDLSSDNKILLDKANLNSWAYSFIAEDVEVFNQMNPSFKMKAVKTDHELENMKNAYIKDSVALTKFLYWLEKNVSFGQINEYNASEKLYEFRSKEDGFVTTSFETIMAFKENAAMMHYRPLEESSMKIEGNGLLLIDSGGQYYDGTTDVTRTIPIGEVSDEEKIDFTLTLKSHIALIGARFLYGTSGHVLDSYARRPMWERGMDYKCGTGHGVGFFLNVHEGPHRFHNVVVNNVALEENMVITIEPGVYKKDRHGVRTENVAIVKKDIETEFGQFMKFEPLTKVHIETKVLKKDLLTDSEINWLNNYHDQVYENISEYLDEDEREWLKTKVEKI